MKGYNMDKQTFLSNYRGCLIPEIAWQQAVAAKKNRERYKDATYSNVENRRAEREANNWFRL